jgi:IPT/TIG domain
MRDAELGCGGGRGETGVTRCCWGALALVFVAGCHRDSVDAAAYAAYSLSVVSGDLQSAPAGSVLPQAIAVELVDGTRSPVKDAIIVFKVQNPGASGSRMIDTIGVTGPNGVAMATLQLGTVLDTTTVIAYLAPANQRSVLAHAIATAAPLLTAVTPSTFGAGDTITLRGSGLAGVSAAGGIQFGTETVAAIAGATDSLVRAVAPACLAPGSLGVRVAAGTVMSNAEQATYLSRSTPVALAPLSAMTVNSAQLAGCLTLPGNGANYLVVGQFASEGDPLTLIGWQIGTAVAGGASSSASASRLLRASADNRIQRQFESTLRRMERAIAPRARAQAQTITAQRQRSASILEAVTVAQPAPVIGSLRNFKVVASLDGSTFSGLTARLAYAGTHILLYVDTVGQGFSADQYQALAVLFDHDLYPIDIAAFGSESDVDQNGRVIVLFTPKINELISTSDCGFAGYVTGFFFPTDLLLDDPNSNKGEIFYSYIPDSLGAFSCPHTAASVLNVVGGTFLHELEHMIAFNQHVIARGGADEEEWLTEGLGQIAEELGSLYYEARYPAPSGRSTTTQIFPDSAEPFIEPQLLDAYVYLNSTLNHSVTSYNGGGSLEERGATWLFLRWLASQKGDDIFGRLVQTSNTGIANIEAQAGEPFGALFGDFSAALWVDSLPGVPRSSIPSRFQFGSRNLRLLMAREATVETFPNPWPLPLYTLGIGGALSSEMLPGTMVHSSITPPVGASGVSLSFGTSPTVSFPASLGAQVTIFRLPP